MFDHQHFLFYILVNYKLDDFNVVLFALFTSFTSTKLLSNNNFYHCSFANFLATRSWSTELLFSPMSKLLSSKLVKMVPQTTIGLFITTSYKVKIVLLVANIWNDQAPHEGVGFLYVEYFSTDCLILGCCSDNRNETILICVLCCLFHQCYS